MAKRVVFNEVDPGIGITLSEWLPANGSAPRGWRGSCTECGKTIHRWDEEKAVRSAQAHVDSHEPVLIGGDTDALVR